MSGLCYFLVCPTGCQDHWSCAYAGYSDDCAEGYSVVLCDQVIGAMKNAIQTMIPAFRSLCSYKYTGNTNQICGVAWHLIVYRGKYYFSVIPFTYFFLEL